MTIPYDTFKGAFLSKITEYELYNMYDSGDDDVADAIVDGCMKRTVSNSMFKKVFGIDFLGNADDDSRAFNVDIKEDALDEIVDIVSEGMVEHWLKPYLYNQENLQNILNTRDYTMYSPAELILRIGNAHKQAHANYVHLIREHSYNVGDLTSLHL
jgi:hypothetical protein